MAKILITGNPISPHIRERGLVGKRAGHDIFWCHAKAHKIRGVTTFGLPNFVQSTFFLRALVEPFFVARIIRLTQPDIVHVHYASTGLAAIPLSRFPPLVVTVMGGDILPEQGYRGFYKPFIRLLLARADLITSKSSFMDAALGNIGDYGDKVRRITWGIDLKRFYPHRPAHSLRAQWEIPADHLVIFDPRAARPFYNKHISIKAFALFLRTSGIPAVLLVSEFLGEAAYLSHLRLLVDELGITENVRFVGTIPHADMPDYYALSDVTLSVAPSDGLAQTVYEALAGGSFLIIGNLPQYTGVVEDFITARLVPIGDEVALADAIHWAASHPENRRRAAELGRYYVEKHADFDVQAERVNQLYDELLKKNENPG